MHYRSKHPVCALMAIVMVMLCSPGCRPTPSHDYSGTLTLTYARTFPVFTATASMDVAVFKSGDVLIAQPDQVSYAGESEMELDGDKVKIREEGTITVTSLEGAWVVRGGVEYLEVTCNTLIDGTQTTWGWDDDMGWIQAAEIPFSVEDPAKPPLLFEAADAVLGSGASIGVTTPAFGGTVTYRWTLLLVTSLVQQ